MFSWEKLSIDAKDAPQHQKSLRIGNLGGTLLKNHVSFLIFVMQHSWTTWSVIFRKNLCFIV